VPTRRNYPQSWFALALLATAIVLTVAGCEDPKTYRWDEYRFNIPGGSGVLDVRPTHPYLGEFEYRLHGSFNGKMFSVLPFPQTGGKPNMRLDWVPKSKLGGPYLIITHEVSGRANPELLDFRNGALVDLSGDYPNPKIKSLQKLRSIFIGTLDENCDFRTSEGMVFRESVPPGQVK
jgi:hypothetical protein